MYVGKDGGREEEIRAFSIFNYKSQLFALPFIERGEVADVYS